jgi:1,2-diacylglycerol 3-alpha-glucosyltransferase
MKPPRVAIACPGIGHVRRGNESWAVRTASVLHRAGLDVTLFGGRRIRTDAPYRALPCIRRDVWFLRWMPLYRRYQQEQWLFTRVLRSLLARAPFDVVHTGDPQVAWWLRRAFPSGWPAVIYKDGLLLGPVWNRHFDWVQVLSPWALEEGRAAGAATDGWRMIPHCIDTAQFNPPAEPAAAKRALGLPGDAIVALSVGALDPAGAKRHDYIASEIAGVRNVHWLVAGQAAGRDQAAFERMARPLLGERLHLLVNRPQGDMPSVFQAADVFIHAALKEPFGIVFLEALATGVPVLAHEFGVTRWITGEGGRVADLNNPGALRAMLNGWLEAVGEHPGLRAAARRRGESFGWSEWSRVYMDWYAEIADRVRGRAN